MSQEIGSILEEIIENEDLDFGRLNETVARHNRRTGFFSNTVKVLVEKLPYTLPMFMIGMATFHFVFNGLKKLDEHNRAEKDVMAHINVGNYDSAHKILKDKLAKYKAESFQMFAQKSITGDMSPEIITRYFTSQDTTIDSTDYGIISIPPSVVDNFNLSIETITASNGVDFAVTADNKNLMFFNADRRGYLYYPNTSGQLLKTPDDKSILLCAPDGDLRRISLSAVKKPSGEIKYIPIIAALPGIGSKISGVMPSKFPDGIQKYFANTASGEVVGFDSNGVDIYRFNRNTVDNRQLPVRFADINGDGKEELITYVQDGILIINPNGTKRQINVSSMMHDNKIYGIEVARFYDTKKPSILVFGEESTTAIRLQDTTVQEFEFNDCKVKGTPIVLLEKNYDRIVFKNSEGKLQYLDYTGSQTVEMSSLNGTPSFVNTNKHRYAFASYNDGSSTDKMAIFTMDGKEILDMYANKKNIFDGVKSVELNGKKYVTLEFTGSLVMLQENWLDYLSK